MENQNGLPPNEFRLVEKKATKKKIMKIVGGILIAGFIFFSAVFLVWRGYLSPTAKSEREARKNIEAYITWEKNYTEAMKADIYGGKTPEETLKMFIEALEKGDIELASKYFALDTNENSEYYLTRKEWENGLKKIKEENRVKEIIDILLKLQPDKSNQSREDGDYGFAVYDNNGTVEVSLLMKLNKYSNVWKIESL